MGDDMENLAAYVYVSVSSLTVICLGWYIVRCYRLATIPDSRPRCKHGTARPLKCSACDAETLAFFNEKEPHDDFLALPRESNGQDRARYTSQDYVNSDGATASCDISDFVPTWVTKDGRRMPLYAMTTEHLQNTVRLLARRYDALLESDNKVIKLARQNGMFWPHWTPNDYRPQLMDAGPRAAWPIYTQLVDELQSRLHKEPL